MLTNREKIDKMSSKELANKIKSLRMLSGFEYIDWESWLKSESSEFPYIGDICKFKPYEETFAHCDWINGIIVDSKSIGGIDYKIIVSQGTLYRIPWNRVKNIDDIND